MRALFLALPAIIVAAPSMAADFARYDKAAFDRLLASGKPVLVHVHADWCPTCRRQISAFPVALRDAGAVQKVVVNFDADNDFKAKYNVRNQSTLIVFKGGKEIARGIGTTDPAAIKALVDKAI